MDSRSKLGGTVVALLLVAVTVASVPAAALAPVGGADNVSDVSRASAPGGVRSADGPGPGAAHPDAAAGVDVGPNRSANATTLGTVTLLTGHEVTVRERGGERTYALDSAGAVHRFETPRGTFFVPDGVDLDRFSPSLFNVDRLVNRSFGTGGGSIPLIVQFREGTVGEDRLTPAGESRVADLGLSVRRTIGTVDAVAARVPIDRAGEVYRNLANSTAVERVSPDLKLSVFPSHRSGDANATLGNVSDYVEADDARAEHGVTGENVTVAVVDSGVDETHPAIAGDEVAEFDVSLANDTTDQVGHGTHVAGIITAEGGNESYRGVAPDAEVIDVGVGNDRAFTSTILDGMEIADDRGADIVSMSLGLPPVGPRSGSVTGEFIRTLTRNGTLVVVAAGNSGSAFGTVSRPGIMKPALTVGASNANGTDVAWFSSRGPTNYEWGVKPDLVAPGTNVISTTAKYGEIAPGQGWTPLSGTSMATPATSGAAALLMEAHPQMTPAEVKQRLVGTADRFRNRTVYAQGGGQVDVEAAIESPVTVDPATLDFGTVNASEVRTKTVTVQNQGDSARTLDVEATARQARSDADAGAALTVGTSSVTVPAGGSASFEVTVDGGESPTGIVSGRLRVGNHSTSFGWTHPNVVTVTKEALPGESVAGDTVGFVTHSGVDAGSVQFATLEDATDRVRFVTTGTEVSVFSAGLSESSEGVPIHTFATLDAEDDASVTLDESETVTARVDPGRIEAEVGPVATLGQSVRFERIYSYGASTGTVLNGSATTRVRFTGGATDWEGTVRHLFVPRSALGNGTALQGGADIYKTSNDIDPDEGSQVLTPDPAEMGTMTLDVPSLGPHQEYRLSVEGGFAPRTIAGGASYRLHAGEYVDFAPVLSGTNTETGTTWTYDVGYRYGNEDTVVEVVPLPIYSSWDWYVTNRTATVLSVPKTTAGSFRTNDTSRTTVSVEGETLRGTTASGSRIVRLRNGTDVEPGDAVTIRTVGNNTATAYGTTVNSTLSFTYEPTPRWVELPVLENVEFRNERHLESAIPSSGGTATVDVRGVNVTDLDAYVSADGPARPFENGGAGWTEANVTWTADGDYRVEFDASQFTGERFDLALRAENQAGQVVTSVTRNALRVVEDETLGPVERADGDGDGEIDTDELQWAISQWARGEFTTEQLQQVISAWARSG